MTWSPKYSVLLCFSGEGRVADAFALVYLTYSFKERCWILYLPDLKTFVL